MMTVNAIKPPYTLMGEQGTAIWSGDELIASMNEARTHPRRARKTAEFIVRACNRDHLFDDLVKALAVARSSIKFLEEQSDISIGQKPIDMIERTLAAAKEHAK